MNSKKMLFVAVVIVIITNVFWAYIYFDRALTNDYMQQEMNHLKEDINLMRNLIIDLSCLNDKNKIISLLKSKYSKCIIKEEDGALFVDRIGLKFINNKLSSIVLMNE